ncbi:DUF305 domain-containing protein [Arthrobacter antioxidans]|uniref:DUF305 domain-containing protein n=1 Tax=Arthrobacter antioxidans TaxID=2895818 RepID=UPI001FFF3812|nr:DUF305 domain-containing protein [Arthrobacter antioxidans]
MKRSLSLASLSVAALITLSACGSSGGDTAGTSGESSAAAAPSATAQASTGATTEATPGSSEATAEHNDVDVMFAQMMIPHHQQAVEMSDMMLSKDNISPEITDLATKIKDAQGPEIETMTGWLEAWDEPMEPEGGMEGHSMSTMGSDMGGSGSMEGMMSEDQMSQLESAEGTEASRIFLESMTAHHEGAVSMAENEIENGQNPQAIELAETIVETQNAEIAEMEELLAGL